MKLMLLAMVDHKEMQEEGNLQPVVFLERLDMNLLKLKKVSIKSILLTDKPFKISRILLEKILKTVNLFHNIHRKNLGVENHKIDLKM
jgi:hypothetical protein